MVKRIIDHRTGELWKGARSGHERVLTCLVRNHINVENRRRLQLRQKRSAKHPFRKRNNNCALRLKKLFEFTQTRLFLRTERVEDLFRLCRRVPAKQVAIEQEAIV